MPSDFSSVGCASSPASTVIGGAPKRPSASTFHPACRSTELRAAASAVKFAMVPPVTNAVPLATGRSNNSMSHCDATCSRCDTPGVTL